MLSWKSVRDNNCEVRTRFSNFLRHILNSCLHIFDFGGRTTQLPDVLLVCAGNDHI